MGITYLVCVLAVLSCVVIRDCDGKPTERELSILADLIELEVENRNIAKNKVGRSVNQDVGDAEAVDDDPPADTVDDSEPGPELKCDGIIEKFNNNLRDVKKYILEQIDYIKHLLENEHTINDARITLEALSTWIHVIVHAGIQNNAVLEKEKNSVDNAAKFIKEKEAEIEEQGAILDTTDKDPIGSAGGPSGAGSAGGSPEAGSEEGSPEAGSSEAGSEEGSPEAGSSGGGPSEGGSAEGPPESGSGPPEGGSAEGPPESGSGPPEGGSAEGPPESGSAEGPPESGSGPPEGGSAEGPPESGSAGGPPESGPAGGAATIVGGIK